MDIPDDWGREHNLGLYEDTFDAAIRFQKEFLLIDTKTWEYKGVK